MNAKADVAFRTTLAALTALERGPVRHYPSHPLAPTEDEEQHEQDDPRDAEQFFYDEQSPSDASFR